MLKAQGLLATCLINKKLPVEIIGLIFEEHAVLEWKAPTVDGRVCRLWRQIILNTPRAWAYLEIYYNRHPSTGQLRVWLCRSGSVPLHIRVEHTCESINLHTLYDLVAGHHRRIASLRMREGELSFFEGREFPRMQLLDIKVALEGPLRSSHWSYASTAISPSRPHRLFCDAVRRPCPLENTRSFQN
jgi:hypothetical protein